MVIVIVNHILNHAFVFAFFVWSIRKSSQKKWSVIDLVDFLQNRVLAAFHADCRTVFFHSQTLGKKCVDI